MKLALATVLTLALPLALAPAAHTSLQESFRLAGLHSLVFGLPTLAERA